MSRLRKFSVYPCVAGFPDPISDPDRLHDFIPVVIDVLRATSTIVTALYNGAKEFRPCLKKEEAVALHAKCPPGTAALGGTVAGGDTITGFPLGNSPLEYNRANVSGKVVFFSTTNGTRAIRRVAPMGDVFICSFLNFRAVAEYLIKHTTQDIAVCCSGTDGEFSIEDSACAGALADAMGGPHAVELNDMGWAAWYLFNANRHDILHLVMQSRHSHRLVKLGLGADLDACSQMNTMDIVPVMRSGREVICPVTPPASPLTPGSTSAASPTSSHSKSLSVDAASSLSTELQQIQLQQNGGSSRGENGRMELGSNGLSDFGNNRKSVSAESLVSNSSSVGGRGV